MFWLGDMIWCLEYDLEYFSKEKNKVNVVNLKFLNFDE